MKSEFEFIDKTVFFPKEGILAIGDLHIGYEHALIKSGFQIPETQIEDTIKDLEKIVGKIKEKKYKIKKIVFLGDLKHYFSYERKEKFYFNKILEFLKEYVEDENIFLVKGNHDTFDFTGRKMENYHIENDIAFLHGHAIFPEVFDKKIRIIVTGHLHPSILLSDNQNIKSEKYKCFLVGEFKNKKTIVLPSFFGMIEGTPVNENFESDNKKDFSIIPKKILSKFKVYAIGENNKIFDFGEVRRLK